MPIYVFRGGDERWRASVAELPGCLASAATRDEAIAGARRAVREYQALLAARDVTIEHTVDPDALEVREPPEPHILPEDLAPMEEHEIRDFLHRFEAFHAEMLDLVRGLSQDELERRPADGEWPLRELLEHVMLTEVALLSRLEPWPRGDFGTLNAIRRLVAQRFAAMDATDTQGEHTILGKRWTAKKVTRRLLEHAFEHVSQIRDTLAALRR